ncbi:PepSY domain-containing protein [Rhodanobacter terrae]|uniref:PepSY domain-containing protein n=1 Tax=Rhodanobacter terrae TaxID=418647 RepID=A0ABW0SYL7_9GAMM
MTTHKNFIPALLIWLIMGVVATASAQSSEPAVTLDQAVLKVQQDTGGRILSAEPHRVDRKLKYFIKVLTPDGHVQKLVVSSEASKNPASNQSTKNPPAKRAGSKEKH